MSIVLARAVTMEGLVSSLVNWQRSTRPLLTCVHGVTTNGKLFLSDRTQQQVQL